MSSWMPFGTASEVPKHGRTPEGAPTRIQKVGGERSGLTYASYFPREGSTEARGLNWRWVSRSPKREVDFPCGFGGGEASPLEDALQEGEILIARQAVGMGRRPLLSIPPPKVPLCHQAPISHQAPAYHQAPVYRRAPVWQVATTTRFQNTRDIIHIQVPMARAGLPPVLCGLRPAVSQVPLVHRG